MEAACIHISVSAMAVQQVGLFPSASTLSSVVWGDDSVCVIRLL